MLVHEWQNRITRWAEERKIFSGNTPFGQYAKLIEEAGELGLALAHADIKEIKDGLGDCLVVLTIITESLGFNLDECAELAWQEIKDRKGTVVDGVFVKEEEIQRPDCSVCQDRGEISYYYDCGDHFGAGTAPGSEWRTKPCPVCKGEVHTKTK